MTVMSVQPQVVESYDDGTYMWGAKGGYACSWDGPFAVGNNSQDRIPRIISPWLPSIAAARLAWAIAKPEKEVKSTMKYKATNRYAWGFTNPRGVFGSNS